MRRVVITGAGVQSPIGLSIPAFGRALEEARSGVREIPEMKALGLRCQVAAQISDLDVANDDALAASGREVGFAYAAAKEAAERAGLPANLLAESDAGAVIACDTGGSGAGEALGFARGSGGPVRATAKGSLARATPLAPAAALALRYHLRGRVMSAGASCTGGLVAIGAAFEAVQAGRADLMLAGGTDHFSASVSGIAFDSWRAIVSGWNAEPERACRPYDMRRGGFVLGEGAGVVVVEALEHAERRGAPVCAEIVGYALTNDGHDFFRPTGEGLERAMRDALRQGRADLSVDYVNSHGAGTRVGDPVEAKALARVLGEETWVSSIKPLCGHSMAAAGAVELVATLCMMEGGFLTPTRNLEEVAPDCAAVRHVQGETIAERVDTALCVNLGLGGTNAALVLARL